MEQTYESVLDNPPSITEDLAEVHRDFLLLPHIPKISLVAVLEGELLDPLMSWGACWESSSLERLSSYSCLAILIIGYAALQWQHIQYGCLLVHVKVGQITRHLSEAIPEIWEAIH